MQKIFGNIIKRLLDIFAFFIKKSKDLQWYLFTHALKKETDNFIENEYFRAFEHINKTITLGKKLAPKVNNAVIVDVGGLIGKTAVMYSKAFPHLDIFLYEPIQQNFTEIQKNTAAFKNIKAFKKALGNSSGKSTINIAGRVSSSSLLELNNTTSPEIFSGFMEKKSTEDIEINTLDAEIPADKNILILKLDVQGFELEVLKGGMLALNRTACIVLETGTHNAYVGSPQYHDIDEFLRHHDFVIYDILPSTKNKGQLVEWDSIYIHKRYL
jgi:FkbM family methyltransferase